MNEAAKLAEDVLKRSQSIKTVSPKAMTSSADVMATIAAQVNSAPKLAAATQVLLEGIHQCVQASFDETTRRVLVEAVQNANDACRPTTG
jgi:hypothetical protein